MTENNKNVEWLIKRGKKLSPLGIKVASILGEIYAGLYHIDKEVLHKRTKWGDEHYIEVVVHEQFSTYDSSNLTQIVVLCHNEAVRLGISAASHNYLKLSFSPRERDGSMSQRHPTIEEAVFTINQNQ